MDSQINGFYEEKRTIWSHLGFGTCSAFFEDDDEDDGFAPGSLLTETFGHFDWRDRLRVLVSGKIMISARTKTDVPVDTAVTVSKVSILPPSWSMKGNDDDG